MVVLESMLVVLAVQQTWCMELAGCSIRAGELKMPEWLRQGEVAYMHCII